MSSSCVETLISALQSACAPADLVATAHSRFAARKELAEACDALHRELSADKFNFGWKLRSKTLEVGDSRVLSWFLAQNTSCTALRCVSSPERSDDRVLPRVCTLVGLGRVD